MSLKKYMIALGYTLGLIVVFTLIISILNYFDLITNTVFDILKLVVPIISTIVGGFIIGKNSDRNGYKSGIKFGLIYSGFAFLLNLIFFKLSLGVFIFFAIMVLSSMFGSMIGINRKPSN